MKSNQDIKQPELSAEQLQELFDLGPDFIKRVFLGKYIEQELDVLKIGPDEKTKLTPITIVAFYMAYINKPSIRKLFAPYFLDALNACSKEEKKAMIEGTRPVESETYRAIEQVGKQSNNIEAYICYALVINDYKKLKIRNLLSVMHYLFSHHPDKINIHKMLLNIVINSSWENVKDQYDFLHVLSHCGELQRLYKSNDNLLTFIRRKSVVAILKTLQALDENIDIKPCYDAAYNHSCFAHRNKPLHGFFDTATQSSQKILREGYNKIINKRISPKRYV